MNTELVIKELVEAREKLDQFINEEGNIQSICLAADLMVEAFKAGNKILACGNGGSMCDAMHFAEELSGKYRNDRPPLPALSISDPSYISCVGNDYGFDFVFSRFVEATGNKGDILLAISTSGNSANVINAARKAKENRMKVVTLTGRKGGSLANLADVDIRAPLSDYSDRIQEVHIKVIHILIRCIEVALFGK